MMFFLMFLRAPWSRQLITSFQTPSPPFSPEPDLQTAKTFMEFVQAVVLGLPSKFRSQDPEHFGLHQNADSFPFSSANPSWWNTSFHWFMARECHAEAPKRSAYVYIYILYMHSHNRCMKIEIHAWACVCVYWFASVHVYLNWLVSGIRLYWFMSFMSYPIY